MSSKLSCSLSIFLVLVLTGFAQAELLLNPGFEAGLESWNTWGSGSGAGGWSDAYHATALADGTAHGGDGYVQVGFNPPSEPWWGYAFAFQEHVVTEGEAYVMGVWYRDGDADGDPSFIEGGATLTWEWRDTAPTEGPAGARGELLDVDGDGAGGNSDKVNYPVDLTEEWTYFSAIEVAPSGAKGLSVIFGARVAFVNVDIDDASFVELGLQALHILELLNEAGAGVVALEVRHVLRLGFEPLRLHEVVQDLDGGFEFVDNLRGLVHQPDFAGLFGFGAGEERDGGVDGVLLLAEVEDVAVGLGGVENAIGAQLDHKRISNNRSVQSKQGEGLLSRYFDFD